MRQSRQEILAREELAAAPVAYQRQFWIRYNRRNVLRRTAALGEAVSRLVSDEALWAAKRLGGTALAWSQVVPRSLARKTRVESLRRGRLVVLVDSAATRYVLTRQMNTVLMEALNKHPLLSQTPIKQIEYRIGSSAERNGAEKRR